MYFSKALMLAAVATACLLPHYVGAQEEQVESTQIEMAVFDSDDGAGPMVFSTLNGSSIQLAPNMLPGGTDFVMPAPDPFSLINNPSVQKDLELVGDQLEKVRKLQKEHNRKIQDHFKGFKDGSINLNNMEDLRSSMEELKAKQREELNKLLLPQQVDRLKQIAFQTHMRQSGTANALASKKIAEELGLSNEQVKALKDKAKELKKKLAEDIEKLKEKLKEELLSDLTSEQREKIKAMTGEKYQPKKEDWQDRFRSIHRSRGRMNRDN